MIDSCTFGSMVIDGNSYNKDLIILPDSTILHHWWRKSGHTLSISDIQEVIAGSPDILVVGTGMPGLMKPDKTFRSDLESLGIETRIMPTGAAVKEYNLLQKQGRQIAGCFHLTC